MRKALVLAVVVLVVAVGVATDQIVELRFVPTQLVIVGVCVDAIVVVVVVCTMH